MSKPAGYNSSAVLYENALKERFDVSVPGLSRQYALPERYQHSDNPYAMLEREQDTKRFDTVQQINSGSKQPENQQEVDYVHSQSALFAQLVSLNPDLQDLAHRIETTSSYKTGQQGRVYSAIIAIASQYNPDDIDAYVNHSIYFSSPYKGIPVHPKPASIQAEWIMSPATARKIDKAFIDRDQAALRATDQQVSYTGASFKRSASA